MTGAWGKNSGRAMTRRRLPFGRRFAVRFVRYLETFGYALVFTVLAAIAVSVFWRVDDRITAGNVPIEPHTDTVKYAAPVVVTRTMAAHGRMVAAGEPVAEVIEGAGWAARVEMMNRWDAAQKAAQARDKAAPARDAVLEAQFALWRKEIAAVPRRVITAPASGLLLLPESLQGAEDGAVPVQADAPVVSVADTRRLSLRAGDFSGETAADARPGQKAFLRNIRGEGGSTTLRVDAAFGISGATRLTTRDPAATGDTALREHLKRILGERRIAPQNDMAFALTAVESVEVTARADGRRGAGEPNALAEPPASYAAEGVVREGKHRATVQVAGAQILSAADSAALTQTLQTAAEGKNFRVPQGASGAESLGATNLRDLQVIAKVTGEASPDAAASAAALRRAVPRDALRGASVARSFEAVVDLPNPPLFLQQQVEQALKGGGKITATVEIQTGRRPVALLLFKR